MRFRKGNKIRYGQDMRQFQGMPSGVDFEVVKILNKRHDKMISLKALGYGTVGNYGNGRIHIYSPSQRLMQRALAELDAKARKP